MEGRFDLWFLNINWEDRVGDQVVRSGETSILVFQPTVAGGYQYPLKKTPLAIELGLAFGVEWNIATSGEAVGEGGISLLHLGLTYRLR